MRLLWREIPGLPNGCATVWKGRKRITRKEENNMLNEARLCLKEAADKGGYMSIAIRKDDAPGRGGFVPWEKTATDT